MEVSVLGPVLVRASGVEVQVGGRQARRILARLALGGHREVTVGALAQAAWGDHPPATARHTIATYILRLRRAGLAIRTTSGGYCLDTPTDVEELDLARAPTGAAETSVRQWRRVLSIWRGRPFVDVDHVPEAVIEAARLEEAVETIREDLLAAELDGVAATDGDGSGDGLAPLGLVGTARRLVEQQPYRERRRELLMLALYRSGRQAEALDAYAEARHRLVEDLGLEPGPSLRRMQHAVLSQDPGLDVAFAPRHENQPVPAAPVPGTSTRLIGREYERRALAEVWSRARLATLVGPPGVGKTRLALEAARSIDGPVWFVPLEQVPGEQSVAGAVLDAIAPSSRATTAEVGVLQALSGTAGHLVLDGCERRVQEVAGEVALVLRSCPGIRVLVTSRERLGLLDEALVPVAPLSEDEAVELLVDRARLGDPGFSLEEGQMGSARRLCDLVDRLPLGIELVARHLRLLEVGEVAERVETDLKRWAGMPAGGRTGLWAALDASVEPLGVSERHVLMAMAVMGPDADLGLIGQVAGWPGAEDDLFDTVARLVDASLVQVRSGVGAARYELLRSVAVYTLERSDPAWLADARHRYERAVMSAAATLAGQLTSADRSSVLRRLDREMPHVRNVLGPLCAPPVDAASAARGLEVAVALGDYWLGRHPAEGLQLIEGLLTAANPEPEQRAEAQLRRSHLAYWLTEFSIGAAIAEEARHLFAGLGDRLGEGRALRRLGAISAATDDMVAARRWLEASLERLEEAGTAADIGTTLLHLGSLLADEGDVAAARPALARALAIATAGGDPLARAHALAALNLAHWKAGDLPAALSVGGEALNVFRELGHRPTEGTVAYRLAAVARGLGRPKAARRYALMARAAGEQSSTRSTVAMAEINLSRLDLDDQAWSMAAEHLGDALDAIDPEADRWVLVEALEAVARLAVGLGRAEAAPLLAISAGIRREIHQPVSPTEAADLSATLARSGGYAGQPASPDAATAHQMALTLARHLATPVPMPSQQSRPRR